jgi:hypothetical protein
MIEADISLSIVPENSTMASRLAIVDAVACSGAGSGLICFSGEVCPNIVLLLGFPASKKNWPVA